MKILIYSSWFAQFYLKLIGLKLNNTGAEFSCRLDIASECLFFCAWSLGTSINDVLCFSAILDLPTYPTLSYNVVFLELFWTHLHTLKQDVIYGRSLFGSRFSTECHVSLYLFGDLTSVIFPMIDGQKRRDFLVVERTIRKNYKQKGRKEEKSKTLRTESFVTRG